MQLLSLKKQNDFNNVFNRGNVFGNKAFAFYFVKNGLEENRIGIIVSKKVSKKAVVRNRLRRQIREAYRLNHEQFVKGYDLILIGKQSLLDTGYTEIEKSLKHLFYKKNLMRQKNG
ncbi:ribonuclease P protein component [Eubacteriaceae bacterium ES2]|nr:ribonuclease P protein component [Eubacteriaceae bacterium ES2]